MWRYAATFLHFGFLLTCFHLLPRLPHFHPGWIPAQMHIKFFVLLLPRACNTESLHLMTWFLHTEPLLGIAWLQLCDGQWGQGVPNRSNIFKYIVPNILLCRAWMLFFNLFHLCSIQRIQRIQLDRTNWIASLEAFAASMDFYGMFCKMCGAETNGNLFEAGYSSSSVNFGQTEHFQIQFELFMFRIQRTSLMFLYIKYERRQRSSSWCTKRIKKVNGNDKMQSP